MMNDDVDIPPMDGEAEEMSFRKEDRHKQRNAYEGEADRIQGTLAALYQENSQHGNFAIEVKRFYPEEGKWKMCGNLSNLSIESVPSPDWVGRKFGGGSFKLICRFKSAKGVPPTKSFTIDLAEDYDKLAEKAGNKPLSAQLPKADGICAADPLEAIKGVAELSKIAGVGTRQASNPLLEALLKNQTEIQTAILQSVQMRPQDGKVSEAMEAAKTMAELAKPKDNGELISLLINQMQVQAKEQQQNMLAFLQVQAQQSQQMTQYDIYEPINEQINAEYIDQDGKKRIAKNYRIGIIASNSGTNIHINYDSFEIPDAYSERIVSLEASLDADYIP